MYSLTVVALAWPARHRALAGLATGIAACGVGLAAAVQIGSRSFFGRNAAVMMAPELHLFPVVTEVSGDGAEGVMKQKDSYRLKIRFLLGLKARKAVFASPEAG